MDPQRIRNVEWPNEQPQLARGTGKTRTVLYFNGGSNTSKAWMVIARSPWAWSCTV
jgi:hypothetical protein